jgi:ferredoxin-NADP reductase
MPTPVKLPAVVAEVIEHAPDLRSYLLLPERALPRFRPGQFLHLALDPYSPSSHWPESRVFSIASSPDVADRLRITVSLKGAFTRRLFGELAAGGRVWVKLPFGSFCPTVSPEHPAVLLAGGTGITPFVSFVEWASVRRPEGLVQVHYAARRPDLLIYRDLLESCRARWPSLELGLYAEEPGEADEQGGLRRGRIEVAQLWSGLPDPRAARFYLSGPKGMIDAFRQALLELGARADAVITDEWG